MGETFRLDLDGTAIAGRYIDLDTPHRMIDGISSLVFALIQAPDKGCGAPLTIYAFVVSFLVLALFVVWELHTDEPMHDITFFGTQPSAPGAAACCSQAQHRSDLRTSLRVRPARPEAGGPQAARPAPADLTQLAD